MACLPGLIPPEDDDAPHHRRLGGDACRHRARMATPSSSILHQPPPTPTVPVATEDDGDNEGIPPLSLPQGPPRHTARTPHARTCPSRRRSSSSTPPPQYGPSCRVRVDFRRRRASSACTRTPRRTHCTPSCPACACPDPERGTWPSRSCIGPRPALPWEIDARGIKMCTEFNEKIENAGRHQMATTGPSPLFTHPQKLYHSPNSHGIVPLLLLGAEHAPSLPGRRDAARRGYPLQLDPAANDLPPAAAARR
jgi:hypothetical protein